MTLEHTTLALRKPRGGICELGSLDPQVVIRSSVALHGSVRVYYPSVTGVFPTRGHRTRVGQFPPALQAFAPVWVSSLILSSCFAKSEVITQYRVSDMQQRVGGVLENVYPFF